jgi:SRSO17 transposase
MQLMRTLNPLSFPFLLVMADRLYGASTEFLEGQLALDLDFGVAIRANHGIWLGPGERVCYTGWKPCDRRFANGEHERRYLREIIFGQLRDVRYFQLTTDPDALPEDSTRFVMTHLTRAPWQDVGHV